MSNKGPVGLHDLKVAGMAAGGLGLVAYAKMQQKKQKLAKVPAKKKTVKRKFV